MSYAFDGTTGLLKAVTSLGLTAWPVTTSQWVKQLIAGQTTYGCGMGVSGSNDNYHANRIATTNKAQAHFRGAVSASTPSTSAADAVPGTWHHLLTVWKSTGQRTVYFDGVAGSPAPDTQTWVFVAPNTIHVGGANKLTPLYGFGRVAEAAIYGAELSAPDIALLAAAKYPSAVDAANLLWYCTLSLTGGLVDQIGANDLVVQGGATANADHPVMDAGLKHFEVPTTAIDGTVRRMLVFDGTTPLTKIDEGAVTASGGLFRLVCANQALSLSVQKFVHFDNWDLSYGTSSIRGGPAIATVSL